MKNFASPAGKVSRLLRKCYALPVEQIEPAFSPLVPICIELPTRAGSPDNLFVTPRGDLALIECKLWRNPEARRKVVAQVIDYATDMSTWTYEKLQDCINRTQPLQGSGDAATRNLYEMVSAKGEIDEASFHDAVSRNLKRGRFLLLIVGDGIREGAEGMAEFLQQHAGFHFTLAVIELALFETPGKQYIVQPRVFARTTNIDRGIVTLDEGRIIISPRSVTSTEVNGSGRRTSITQEHYFERLEKGFPGISQTLNAFLDELAHHDIEADFGTESLILRWTPDSGRDWNLGTISKHGLLGTDYMGIQAKNVGLLSQFKQYLRRLAAFVPGAWIRETEKETTSYVAQEGKLQSVAVNDLVADEARRKEWVRAINDFQAAVRRLSIDAEVLV